MAVAHQVTTSAVAAATSITFSHTPAGSNRVLYVLVAKRGTENYALSATFDGNAMDDVAEEAGHNYGAIFRLVNPDAVTGNVVISNFTDTGAIVAAASTYTGVNQSDPDDTPVQIDAGSGTSSSQAVTSATDDMVVDMVSLFDDPTLTVGSGQTERVNKNRDEFCRLGTSDEVGAARGTMSWTWTPSKAFSHIAMNINAVAAAAPAPSLSDSVSVAEAINPNLIIMPQVQE